MKKSLAGALLVLSVIAVVEIGRAQDKKQPEHKLIEFHMALLKRGPNYKAAGMPADLRSGHIANVMSLLESGKAVIAGPFADDGDIAGVLIFRAKSAEEARTWAEADPAVKSRILCCRDASVVVGRRDEETFYSSEADDCLSRSADAWREMDAGKNTSHRGTAKGAHRKHSSSGGNEKACGCRSVWR